MDEKAGPFLVTAADGGAAELADVHDGQIHALSSVLPPYVEGERGRSVIT